MKGQFFKPKCPLLFLFILFATTAVSQYSYWTEPQPITDTDNVNPIVILLPVNNNSQNGLLFYEKYNDTVSSAIYMQNLNYAGAQIEVLADTGVHYRNPQFIQLDVL